MNNTHEYRSVISVANKIITKIPSENTKFITDINNFVKELWNQAPEVLRGSECWVPFTNILRVHLDNIEDGWQKEVVDIYMGNV
jgi:hypothetical protein